MHLLVGNSLTRHDFHGKGHDTFVKIAPAHSCFTAALHPEYALFENGEFKKKISPCRGW